MKIPAILCVHCHGKDGVVEATRRVNLPCTPFDGIAVDGLRVLKADWRTEDEVWWLMLEGYQQQHGNAADNFIAHVGGKEKATMWKLKEAL